MVSELCIRCKGKGLCGKPCKILAKFRETAPKPKLHFSGATPPDLFVGRANYPNVNSGILSPQHNDNSEMMSMPEKWIENNLPIEKILELRGQLVYGRSISNIKTHSKLNQLTQELALSSKPVSTEVFLKKIPSFNFTTSKFFSIMTNPAPLKKARLEENPKVDKKVDYLTSDYDVKANTALSELYKSKIPTSHLQKLLSSGLLGVKHSRKMVPTRWGITAVDDSLGKDILEKIRYYKELNEIQLWHHYYNGNHFEVLILPGSWSFEVIEVSMPESNWNAKVGANKNIYMQDYEGFFSRKKYAENVIGAYYADRLACCEYLNRIQRQGTVFLCHEERPEYYAPLGVGIIRESLRKMFSDNKNMEKPETVEQALIKMGMRLKAPIQKYKKMSWILDNYGKQKKLSDFM